MLFSAASNFIFRKVSRYGNSVHFFSYFSALAQRPSFPSSSTLNLMISPFYPAYLRQRKGVSRCLNLHLAAMYVNFHFISHLELVKHYHSIIVNLKTMKSFGFSQNPPFIDSHILHPVYILKSKQKLQYYKSESNLANLLVDLFVEDLFSNNQTCGKLSKPCDCYILLIWNWNLFQLRLQPAHKARNRRRSNV